jgi:chromosome segregation ATPase
MPMGITYNSLIISRFERKYAELNEQHEATTQSLNELTNTYETTVKSLEEYYEALEASQLENSNLKETHQKELEHRDLVLKMNFILLSY